MIDDLRIREIIQPDCQIISEAFSKQGWTKPLSQFEQYFEYQNTGERDVLIAEWNKVFVGYLTIKWKSDYEPFQKQGVPEIVDFNVLKRFQRLGIGTSLMDEAENRIRRVSEYAGIGFGVYKDYGAAQILYINRGYKPDGNGLVKDSVPIEYGEMIAIDDSVVFYLTKKL